MVAAGQRSAGDCARPAAGGRRLAGEAQPVTREPVAIASCVVSARHQPAYYWASLNTSERSVVAIIAEGATNREAAARLLLSGIRSTSS